MKKLSVLIITLITSLTAFSQSATDTIPVKCFPIPVVRLIVKDLLSGDSAKAELKLANQHIVVIEDKVKLKDSIIVTMDIKEKNYLKIIDSERQKFGIMENYSKTLEKDLRRERVKNKFTKLVSGAGLAVLGFFLIVK
jgi:hypothetical protein